MQCLGSTISPICTRTSSSINSTKRLHLSRMQTLQSILGTDLGQNVGRAINDIHRDIIDIAQGDTGLQAIFNPTPLPDLNTRLHRSMTMQPKRTSLLSGSKTVTTLGRRESRLRTMASA